MRTYEEVLRALVDLRAAARLTQAQLAKRMNVAASTISAWETGTNRMDVDQIAAWAKACERVVRVDIYPEGAPTREERLLSAVDGMTDAEIQDVLDAVGVYRTAEPNARYMVLNILKSVATMPR